MSTPHPLEDACSCCGITIEALKARGKCPCLTNDCLHCPAPFEWDDLPF